MSNRNGRVLNERVCTRVVRWLAILEDGVVSRNCVFRFCRTAVLRRVKECCSAANASVLVFRVHETGGVVYAASLGPRAVFARIRCVGARYATRRCARVGISPDRIIAPERRILKDAVTGVAFVLNVDLEGQCLLVFVVRGGRVTVFIGAYVFVAMRLPCLSPFLRARRVFTKADAQFWMGIRVEYLMGVIEGFNRLDLSVEVVSSTHPLRYYFDGSIAVRECFCANVFHYSGIGRGDKVSGEQLEYHMHVGRIFEAAIGVLR